MKQIFLTVLGAFCVIGGLTALGFSFVHYVNAVPMGASVSQGEIGLYLPWYAAPGVLSAALGLILLTFRRRL